MFHLHHPDILRRLQNDFVPVSFDMNTHSIQTEIAHVQTSGGDWFKKAALGCGWTSGETFQGFYLVMPNGEGKRLIGEYGPNNWKYDNLLHAMDEIIARNRTRREKVATAPDSPEDVDPKVSHDPLSCPWPDAAATVLRSTIRVPGAVPPAWLNPQNDFAWVFADEVRAIRDAVQKGEAEIPLPTTLANRLARYHLGDNTDGRGTTFHGAEDIQNLEVTLRVVRREKERVVLSIGGRYSLDRVARDDEDPGNVGATGQLYGEMEIRLSDAGVIRFRALASGTAWGGGVKGHAGVAPKTPYPYHVTFVEGADREARTVSPGSAWIGDRYRKANPW